MEAPRQRHCRLPSGRPICLGLPPLCRKAAAGIRFDACRAHANGCYQPPAPPQDSPYPREVTGLSADVTVHTAAIRQERIPLAILYMVGAGMVFACSSAASKWLVETYPVGEVLFTRTIIGLLACSLFILPTFGLAVFRTARPGAHLIRGVSQACSQSLLLLAFSLMPLAGATAINFSSP